MKIQTKRILVLATSVIALICSVYCLLRVGFSVDVVDKTGWYEKNGVVQYRNYFGRPHKGWQYIDEKLYYFLPKNAFVYASLLVFNFSAISAI